MKIDKDTVYDLAHLSRLSFENNESERMCEELNKILDFVEVLNELDTLNVEPLIFLSEFNQPLRNDSVNAIEIKEAILKNAPLSNDSFFMVPKFVGE